MRARAVAVVVAVLMGGCDRRKDAAEQASAIPAAKQPERTAAEDEDLRVMLAELAAHKACTLIRGLFRGLRDSKRPDVVTGIIWIRDCRITADGTRVTFALSANGWQWVAEEKEKAGATFEVRDHVRFEVEAKIPGALDIGYSRKTHVASLWFTPTRAPEVRFTPVGRLEVDEQGTWSEIFGALSSVVGMSPEEKATDQADDKGTDRFRRQLGDGLSATIDLCSGVRRDGPGRPGNGTMVPRDIGETRRIPAELHENGLAVFGPHEAKDGMTIHVRARDGAVRVELMCQDDGEALAEAFVHGRPLPAVRALATRDVHDKATLKVKSARCPLHVVARPITAGATFDWYRPDREAAAGPLIDCER
jgi:hypothetical protein